MEIKGIMHFVYKVTDWLMKLAYINILWILFAILGLFVFGLFPATISMFTIVRKWILGNDIDFPVFKTFYRTFKKEFIKSNVLGFIIIGITMLFYIELSFIKQYNNDFLNLFYYPLFILRYIFYLTVAYAFPVYVHYNLKTFQLLKNSFLVMLMSPLSTILMILGGIILYITIKFSPIVVLFFSGSVFALITILLALKAFKKIDQKKNELVVE